MTERECISIMTAILMTAINYDDAPEIFNDPRERVVDAIHLAEMIWDEVWMRQITRQADPTDLPA